MTTTGPGPQGPPRPGAPAPRPGPGTPAGSGQGEAAPTLDHLAELARLACHAPVGLVTLVDDEELRFLGLSGLDGPAARDRRAPLRTALCQLVVDARGPVAVTDARLDRRVTPAMRAAVVDGLGLASYLGVPLLGDRGAVVGAVCAMAPDPRAWTASDVTSLEHVAAGVRAEERRRSATSAAARAEALGAVVVEHALDGVVVVDPDGTVVAFNPAAEAMFGRRRDDVVGGPLVDLLVPPDLQDAHVAGMRRWRETGALQRLGARTSTEALRADGTRFPVEIALTSTGPVGGQELLVAHIRDRSEEAARAEELRAAAARHDEMVVALDLVEQHLRAVLDSAPTILFAVDREERVTVSTGAGLRALGFEPHQLVGMRLAELYGDDPELHEPTRRALRGEVLTSRSEVAGRHLLTQFQPLHDAAGGILGAVGVSTDITPQVQVEAELRRLAAYDPLTGLANRAHTEATVASALADGQRLAALLLDLDHFKDINDSLGHGAGDQVLLSVADRLRHRLEGVVVGRLGGDEILVVLPLGPAGAPSPGPDQPSPSDRQAAERLAAQVLAVVSEPVTVVLVDDRGRAEPGAVDADRVVEPVELLVTASVGVVVAPAQADDLSTLLARADAAMYAAKRQGRGCFAHYTAREDTAHRRLTVTSRLRRALVAGALDVHLQPLVRLDDLRPVAFEALARWTDPELGPVSPLEFVALAEDTGLVHDLMDLVVDRAFAAAAGWAGRGLRLEVGVNVATRQLRDRGLPERLRQAAEGHGVDPALVVLELTESAAMDEGPATDRVLRALRDTGMTLVVDDFGVGYSNLARLRDLSAEDLIGAVKLDRSFVTEMPSPRATALVDAFLHTATTLGLHAVAEGIETEEHLAALRRLGCPMGQGWLFGAAMPASRVAPWLEEHARRWGAAPDAA